jgi:HlyD family secretion protein
VNVVLDAVSEGASAGLKIDATINIERLENVLYIGRPVNGRANSEISLFKITDNGAEAVRTQVKLGRSSVNTIEVLDGLKEGDKVIISDMSSVESAERVRLTGEKRLSSH